MNEWILNEWTGAGLIVTDESRDDQRSAAAAAADATAGASRLNAVGWIGWDRTALQLVLADYWYDLQPDTGRYTPAQLRVMHAIRSPRMAVFSGGGGCCVSLATPREQQSFLEFHCHGATPFCQQISKYSLYAWILPVSVETVSVSIIQ